MGTIDKPLTKHQPAHSSVELLGAQTAEAPARRATVQRAPSVRSVRAQSPPCESLWSLAAFWLITFAAATLFAAVLIAPAWKQREVLKVRVRHLAAQCRYLSDTNDHLDRVILSFKHDPEFSSEMARYELDYGAPGEQRLPAPARNWKRPAPPPEPEPVASAPLLQLFAHDTLVRQAALVTAAVLTVVGLAFFNAPRET